MTAPDRINVKWTKSGKATVATPASHGPIADTAAVYVLEPRTTPAAMTPEVRAVIVAAHRVLDAFCVLEDSEQIAAHAALDDALTALRAGGST